MSLSLRNLLRMWSQSGVPIHTVSVAPSKVEKVAVELGGTETQRPPQTDIDQLRRKITQAAITDDFTSLTLRDWRYSPFAVDDADGILFTPLLLQRYLDAVQPRVRSRLLRSLARLYIVTFSPEELHTKQLSEFLVCNIHTIGPQWQAWQKKYEVLSPNGILPRLTNVCMEYRKSPYSHVSEIFTTATLPSWFTASSALMLPILKAAFARLTNNMTTLSEQDVGRIIALSTFDDRNLILGGGNQLIGLMTEALLVPLRYAAANATVRNMVQSFLLHCLKDPRLHPANWSGVRQDVKEIMYRWLTHQSLDLFLEIVDAVVNTSDDAKRMWQNRRRFWGSYLKVGHIDEAWVVLGRDGERHAKQLEARDPKLSLSYAELSYSTDLIRHIALMLRIDSLTIVDWSHNGRCHIWTGENNSHPKLYMREYTKGQLEKGSLYHFTHSAGGSWMYDVANVIRKETGRTANFS